MNNKNKNKYGVGFWVSKVINSCETKEQLKGARRLLSLFENSEKYNPPYELINEIYKTYDERQSGLNPPMYLPMDDWDDLDTPPTPPPPNCDQGHIKSKLAKAIAVENYELAQTIQDKINNQNKEDE